jgi:hypothetical protein
MSKICYSDQKVPSNLSAALQPVTRAGFHENESRMENLVCCQVSI